MITTIVILLYYFWWFVRPLMTSSMRIGGMSAGLGMERRPEFPPLEVLEAFVFAGFAGLSLILALGIFGYRSSFKPADVDVLFPTPVNPRLVLLFRILRDLLATTLIPLFLILITWKPLNIADMFQKVPHPQSAGYAIRALSLGLVLITMTWVGMGYALSLYVNRNDRRSEMRKRIIGWAIALPCLSIVVYTVYNALQFHSVADFVRFTQPQWLHAFFFTATPAANIVMGPLQGNATETIVGTLTLLAIAGLSLHLSLQQADWMYDQATVRGFGAESMRQLQRKGDFMGVMAEAARRGKIKVKKPGWFQGLRTRGFGALLWKDALIQWRSVRGMIILFTLMGVMFVAMPYFAGLQGKHQTTGYLVLVMEGFVAFMVATMTSQSGFAELLRRVDLQKPLPFGPQLIVLSEVLAKALPSMLIPLGCSLLGIILFPASWLEVIAGAIFFPSVGAVICSLVCVIVLLFPEVDDVSQRGFRGLMMMLGMLIVGTPAAAVFILITVVSKSAIIGSIPGAIINYLIAFVLTIIGGSLYAGFNPSE